MTGLPTGSAQPTEAAAGSPATLASPAFPPLVRLLALALLGALSMYGIAAWPELKGAQWSHSGLALVGTATAMTYWMGSWILRSRTRLNADTLSQTWVWHKQAAASDVASMKLVYVPFLQTIIAPRLLVRRRTGGMTWFNSADVHLLLTFMALVTEQQRCKSQRH